MEQNRILGDAWFLLPIFLIVVIAVIGGRLSLNQEIEFKITKNNFENTFKKS